MDFFTRLITGSTSSPRQPTVLTPQQRLLRFKKTYHQVLQTWKSPQSPTTTTALSTLLSRLTTLLTTESRSHPPHLCLQLTSSASLYQAVGQIALECRNESVIREAVGFFAALVDSEGGFVGEEGFARGLMGWVEGVTGDGIEGVLGTEGLGEVVECLFAVAARIRLEEGVLGVWFHGKGDGEDEDGQEGEEREEDVFVDTRRQETMEDSFVGVTQKEDFPLCYKLIEHVHHEGRIGDFARTGLLYIFETASHSKDLEAWLVDSDIPTLMGSGLGALYGQLSRKLSIAHPMDNLPPILALSDYMELTSAIDVDNYFSTSFNAHMETFLSYLTFWQDVLEHCRSVDVRQTLIDHIQVLFLQQLLYPSLLQSSDVDGGSAVAVLTYLRRILEALDHPELVHMILHYLLALEDRTQSSPRSPRSHRKRKSLLQLSQSWHADDEDIIDPKLFNLVDLIQLSLKSVNPQTVTAALKLVSVILSKNHGYAVAGLLRVQKPHANAPSNRTVGALSSEVEAYLSLAEDLGGEEGLDEAYDMHLKDIQILVETHPCSFKMLLTQDLSQSLAKTLSTPLIEDIRAVPSYKIAPSDATTKSMFMLLESFLTNNVETNLKLTETFVTLGSCARCRLEGWMAAEPDDYVFEQQPLDAEEGPEYTYESLPADEVDELKEMATMKKARRPLDWSSQTPPRLMATLQLLQVQVNHLRTEIANLDNLITTRKQLFQQIDVQTRTPILSPIIKPADSINQATPGFSTPTKRLPSDARTPAHMLPLSQLGSGSPSRSSSPRGRQPTPTAQQRAVATSPRPSKLSFSTLTGSPALPLSRTLSPSSAMSVRSGGSQTLVEQPLASPGEEDRVVVEDSEAIRRRVWVPGRARIERAGKAEAKPDVDGGMAEDERGDDDGVEISISHLLTNIVVLQEFVLEIAAVLQVRASLFGEVRFA